MMGEDTMPEGSSPRKVYPYSPGRAFSWPTRIFVVLWVLIAFGYGYAAYLGHFQKAWLVLVAAVWLLLAVRQSAALYLLSRARLVTSPEGLEFFAPGYSIGTTWDNMEKVSVSKWRWSPGFTVLHLRQKPTLVSSSPSRWLWMGLGSRKLIPLYLFQRSSQGELGQDFRRYAPHLFSAEERERPQSALP